MTFNEKLNSYLTELNCTSKELSIKSEISESVISRYRSGERTPKENSEQLKNLSSAIYEIAKGKNINKYTQIKILTELTNAVKKNDNFNYDNFSLNFNQLITGLKINVNEMAKYIVFDASHISRIKYGKAKPSDPIEFCTKVCNYIVSKFSSEDGKKNIATLINEDVKKLSDQNELFTALFNFLTGMPKTDNKDYISDFLNNLDTFNLNDYIKVIKFDKLKVPNIPFYKAKTKNYYGLEEMKKGELDFFKATVLAKSNEDIYMCSDMPMEDMASDIEFGKKWMFAIEMCLKKGLHLNIIHNLDRPFNEMMLGLESWIPIYMTGQISPYFLKEIKNSPYGHLNYVSGKYALCGECIDGYHGKGKYYLTGNNEDVEYYKTKTKLLFKKANSLIDIYNETNKNMYSVFLLNDAKIKSDRKRILNSLPLFTISENLLTEILKRNKISDRDIQMLLNYKKSEETNINLILKDNKITDCISTYTKEDFNKNNNIYLSLENIFFNKQIKYTYEEYAEHLKLTENYNNKNYTLIENDVKIFKNISITMLETNYVIVSKNSNPVIHFVIKHPKLASAVKNFNPLVK